MKTHSTRNQVVRDFAQLTLDGTFRSEAGPAIIEAAIQGKVTYSEMLRETLILEAGIVDREFETNEFENDLVLISSPS